MAPYKEVATRAIGRKLDEEETTKLRSNTTSACEVSAVLDMGKIPRHRGKCGVNQGLVQR